MEAINSAYIFDEVFIIEDSQKAKEYLETTCKRFLSSREQMKKEFTI